MVTDEQIKSYLQKIHGTASFDSLDETDQDNVIFSARELLNDYYREEKLTDRSLALQVLYMLESENEEFATLKKHGITSYSVKGVSVTFDDNVFGGGLISPLVIDLLGTKEVGKKASMGRLI